MENRFASDDSDEIQSFNQAAFSDLMRNSDEASRKWVLTYVERMNISMRSRQWLPAAIAARLILEMSLTGRSIAKRNEDTTQAVLEAIEEAAKRRRDDEAASLGRDAQRQRQAETLLSNLKTAADDKALEFDQKVDSAVKKITDELRKRDDETTTTSADTLLEEARKRLDTSIRAFLKMQRIAIGIALLMGIFLGVAVTHWLDAPRTVSNPTIQSAVRHGK